MRKQIPKPTSQSDKFKDASRELEADEDEKLWEGRLKKVAKQKADRPAESLSRQS